MKIGTGTRRLLDNSFGTDVVPVKSLVDVKPRKILIFLKNGNGSGKPGNFSRSRMTKQTSSLDLSRG